MKTIVFVLLIIVALVLGHNYLQTGKIGFNVSLSEEELELRNLDDRLAEAMSGYRIAGRATAVGGMAPDSSAESAAGTVRRVERELAELKARIEDEDVRAKAQALEDRLRAAKSELGIP